MHRLPWILALALLAAGAAPAGTYHDDDALAGALRSLGGGFAVTELARDAGDRPVWMVTAGSDDPHAPGVLVVAGLDGRHPVGTEMALAHLRSLADDPAALEDVALYVIPRFNPGGTEGFFASPRREIAAAPGDRDTDRDGLVGEDPRDDLDGDGRIAHVRVEDPEGEWMTAGDGDFLRKADAAAGEAGTWRLLTEGRDDDGDEAWNEEADGGVSLARCWPYEFEWFARDAGMHQMDHPVARALGDFIAAHPNIAVVLVYGFEDNLLVSPSDKETSDPDLRGSRWGRDPLSAPNRHDVPLLRELGKRYREALGVPDGAKHLAHGDYGVRYEGVDPAAAPTPETAAKGGLAGFAYYHRGRLALATPVWTPGLQMAWNEAAETDSGEDGEGDDGEESGGNNDATGDAGGGDEADDSPTAEAVARAQAFRDWLLEAHPESWLGWTAVDHPDFPGKRAEAGGFAPFATLNPPPDALDSLAARHDAFFREVLAALPRVGIRTASLTALGGGAHELTVTVENRGYLPDVFAQGVYATHARDTRVEIGVPDGGAVLGGDDRVKLDRIAGSGRAEEIRRIVHLPAGGSVTVRVVSEMAGTDELTLRPGETREGGDR